MVSHPTTGDVVNFKGYKGTITFGNPYWLLKGIEGQVREQDFTILRGTARDKRVYDSKYRFQMDSWYHIDIRKPLFSRISFLGKTNIQFNTLNNEST